MSVSEFIEWWCADDCLDETNLGSNIQSLDIAGQSDIGLLGTIGTNEGVDLGGINIVHPLDSILNMTLIGLQIHNKHQSVILLHLAHGGLGGQWKLENRELVQARQMGNGLAWVLGSTVENESTWTTESGAGADLKGDIGMSALKSGLLSGKCLLF